MIQAGEQVLKTDGLGRVRTPVERREQLLNEFKRSGLSGMKFAALAGLKYPTFAGWLHRRRHQRGVPAKVPDKPVDSVRWLEAVVEQAQGTGVQNPSGIVLELPAGIRVQITNAAQAVLAAALVRSLEKPC